MEINVDVEVQRDGYCRGVIKVGSITIWRDDHEVVIYDEALSNARMHLHERLEYLFK